MEANNCGNLNPPIHLGGLTWIFEKQRTTIPETYSKQKHLKIGWLEDDPFLVRVVVSNIFYFHPYLGKIPILTNIFQRG